MRTTLRTLLLVALLGPSQLHGQAPDLTRQPFDSALQANCNITERDRDNAAAWFEVGAAQRGLALGNFPVRPARCHTEGTSYLTGAGMAFINALDADPNYPEASDALAEVVERNPLWGSGGMARNAFRRAASRGGQESPRVLLLRIRLEREGGERDSALALIARYLEAGGDSGVALFERARERFYRGERDAALDDYWAATARTESIGTYFLIRKNLALVALPGEMNEFDETMSVDRPEWIRRFWTRRDVEAGARSGDRLVEHYRRYEISRRSFRPVGLGVYTDSLTVAQKMSQALLRQATAISGAADSTSFETDSLFGEQSLLIGSHLDANEFGARGLMYMRHGEPDDMAGNFWVYRRDGRDMLVRIDGEGYFGSACNLSARYCRYEMAGRRIPPEIARRWAAEWDTTFAELVTSDDYIRRFKRTLHPNARIYAFPRNEKSPARVLVTIALPGSELTAEPQDSGSLYRVQLHLTLAPVTGEVRVDRDTIRTIRAAAPLKGRAALQLSEEMEVDPDFYQSRLTISNLEGTSGVSLAMDSVDIEDGTLGLSVSDLVLGKESSGFSWWSGTTKVFLNPTGTISRSEPLRLYYQVAGLITETAYSTEVELFRSVGQSRRLALRLSFKDNAEVSMVETERLIGLDRLQPGPYTIKVTIRGEGGTLVTRQGVLVITQ